MMNGDSNRRNSTFKAFLPGRLSFIDFSTSRNTNIALNMNDTHSTFIQEYSLASEFNLAKHRIEPGVYVIPAAKTPYVWYGVMCIRSGLYKGAIFRFRLCIPITYPNCEECPKFIFETPVFHPYVLSTSNELFLGNNNQFAHWNKDTNRLWQIINHARHLFYDIPSISPFGNEAAATLINNDRDKFLQLVHNCIENSKKLIFAQAVEDDPNYFIFNLPDHDGGNKTLQSYKELLLKERRQPEGVGDRTISWIQPGTLKPLSKIH